MRWILTLLAVMAGLAAMPAVAFDAAGADILGLRLGMPEGDLGTVLERQGFRVVRNKAGLSATTRDGQITVDLTGDLGARQIRYIFSHRGVEEQERIRASIIDRFGMPNQVRPMAWCQAVGPDGHCPDNLASLSFQPETLTLLLRNATP